MEIGLSDIHVLNGERAVLAEINLNFPQAKTTVVLGPSGCGKSVLLKVAAGILQPNGGRVTVDGKNMASMSERQNREFRRRTGFVFQDAALWSNNSLFQNMSLPLRFHYPELSEEEVRGRILHLVSRIGFLEDLNLRPAETSLGERKIVSFVRAIVSGPETLFMDEPLSGIHHQVTDNMLNLVRDLKREGRTIIIVTHDPLLTSQVADWLVVLSRGRILECGPTAEVAASTKPEVIGILSRVLSQASTFDDSILDILDERGDSQ